MDEAVKHCTAGLGIWEWASSDKGSEPDVVMACCGDVPTLETLAAGRPAPPTTRPSCRVRVINVVNLMTLQTARDHPHGLSDHDFDALFTTDKPVIFAFHGYPWLIHRLTYRRKGHQNFHVRGYKEEGHHDHAVRHVRAERPRPLPPGAGRDRPGARSLGARAAYAKQAIRDKLLEHKEYIARRGDDMPEITGLESGGRRPDPPASAPPRRTMCEGGPGTGVTS
jgi:xylulose-5-phosphate/fructose-6-phosphate phosphoketolase